LLLAKTDVREIFFVAVCVGRRLHIAARKVFFNMRKATKIKKRGWSATQKKVIFDKQKSIVRRPQTIAQEALSRDIPIAQKRSQTISPSVF